MRGTRVFVVVALLGLVALVPGTAGAKAPTRSRSTAIAVSGGVAAAALPVMTVTPGAGLPYHATARVHLVATARSSALIQQCFGVGGLERCRDLSLFTVPDGATADIDVELYRTWAIAVDDAVDCNTAGTSCFVQLLTLFGAARAPLQFAAATPTLRVTPASGLGWSKRAAVDGAGFRPGEALAMTECARGIRDLGLGPFPYEQCIGAPRPPTTVVGAGGAFSTTFRVYRQVGVFDCAKPAVTCVVRTEVSDPTPGYGYLDTPLQFVDDGLPILEMPARAAAQESDGGARIVVRLRAPSTTTVALGYRTVPGTALDGTDYLAKRSRLVFRPGETRHVITVALVDDAVPEIGKAFRVSFDIVDNAHRTRSSTTVDLHDTDRR